MKHALVAALIVVGCKKTAPEANDVDIAKGMRASMCACKDVACVKGVHTAYDSALPKELGGEARVELLAAMECENKLQAAVPPATPDARVEILPDVPHPHDTAALIEAAYKWQQANEPRLGIAEVAAHYVDATGALDPDHGRLQIEFGPLVQPADDPKRRTGIPIAKDVPRPKTCPTLYFGKGTWRRSDGGYCKEARSSMVRCSVVQIWKQAIAGKYNKAPADGVAVVTYRSTQRNWLFVIEDEPRGVNVHAFFEDNCELAVEKPPQ